MSTSQVHIERRAAQRFEFHLPVSVRVANTDGEVRGFTRDLSAKGAFFYTESSLAEGSSVELTVTMPSEITLTESMRVRCRGKVTRSATVEGKFGAAVHIEEYEFLTRSDEQPAAFERSRIAPSRKGDTTGSDRSGLIVLMPGLKRAWAVENTGP